MKLKRKLEFGDLSVGGSVSIIKPPEDIVVPMCAHGPMVLFRRSFGVKAEDEKKTEEAKNDTMKAHAEVQKETVNRNEIIIESKTKKTDEETLTAKKQPKNENMYQTENEHTKEFFSCSAYRDRKSCPCFYSLDDKKLKNSEIMKVKAEIAKSQNQMYDHKAMYKNFKELALIDAANRKFCTDCNLFMKRVGTSCGTKDVLDFDHEKCSEGGKLVVGIPENMIANPLKLFTTLSNKTAEAQFYFSTKCLNFVSSIAEKYRSVLGIGAPSVTFKLIETVSQLNYSGKLKNVFCLNIDWKLCQIFPPKNFAQFNLCNQHFFTELGEKAFEKFVKSASFIDESSENVEKTLVICDPPYGVKLELFSRLVNFLNSKLACDIIIGMPYFMQSGFEKTEALKSFAMSDYRVEYEGHRIYSGGKKRGSPARFFTNIPLKKLVLPSDESYRLCAKCVKYVHKDNKHCKICKDCTTKDGPTYVHCKKCKTCVKPSFRHCEKCANCHLEDSKCRIIDENKSKRKKEHKIKKPKAKKAKLLKSQ